MVEKKPEEKPVKKTAARPRRKKNPNPPVSPEQVKKRVKAPIRSESAVQIKKRVKAEARTRKLDAS